MTDSEPDLTLLTGILTIQAAVYGVISRLWDLRIPLSYKKVKEIKKRMMVISQSRRESNCSIFYLLEQNWVLTSDRWSVYNNSER